jgi:hypothetical protein
MATSQEFADWLRANQNQRGTPKYQTILRAFQAATLLELDAQAAPAAPQPQPESGMGAAFRANVENLFGAGAALAGRTGLMGMAEAEKAVEARRKRAEEIFKPTEEWGFTKLGELLAGSVPYMALPVAAAGAAAALPLTGTAAGIAGLGAAGLASTAQFTGTNLLRQLETDKKLADTDLSNAALAAVPMALLDTLSMRMVPGVGRLLGDAGIKVTKETVKEVSEQILKKAAIDYTKATGRAMGAEGLTEAAQQGFERLQAGLSLTDADARKEYLDSLIGGALLGGTIAPAGRFLERGKAKREIAAIEKQEADAQAKAAREAEEQKRQSPDYALQLDADYQAAVERMKELQAAVPKNPGKGALPEEQMAYQDAVAARDAHLKEVLQPLTKEWRSRKAEIAQLKERQRVEGMSEEEYADYAYEQRRTRQPYTLVPGEEKEEELSADFADIAPPLTPRLAPELAYAQQRVNTANRNEDADRLDPKEQANAYVPYLMQDPEMARRLVQQQTRIPGLSARTNKAVLSLLKLQLTQYDEQQRLEAEGARPDLYPPSEQQLLDDEQLQRWVSGLAEDEAQAAEAATAAEPVRKEEAIISPEREALIQEKNAARQQYLAAIDAYQRVKGTAEAPSALQQLLAARKEYESFTPGPLTGQAPARVVSPETEAQLDKVLTEMAGAAPASAEELETRIQRLADTRKKAIAKVAENAAELAQYERLTQNLGTPRGLTEAARKPEMAEAAARRMAPMLQQAQASRNEAVAAAIQEIHLQRYLSGLAPLDKNDIDLQREFLTKFTKDLQQAKGKAKASEPERQKVIAAQIQRVESRIRQIEGGDRAGRLLGYESALQTPTSSAFATFTSPAEELDRLYAARRHLTMQQGLTPQAAQLNRSLQKLVDFYTVGGGAAKPKPIATGQRVARRELVLGKRSFTGYEPTVEGTEVQYNKPRRMAEYKATPEEQALVEDMRAQELAALNEAADRQYTPETSAKAKQQIFDELRSRIDSFNAPATQEEVDAAKAQAAPQDTATGDLFTAATERAQAELQAAGERRAAARSEVGRAMAGMRGKAAIMDQAQRLAEKFGKDLGVAPKGTFAAAKTRLTQARAAAREAGEVFKEKEQEALRAAADDALIAQRNAEAASRAANNTVEAIQARFASEKETPAVEVPTPSPARALLRKIVELRALIGQKGPLTEAGTRTQKPTEFSPSQFIFKRTAAEKQEDETGPVQDALNQALRAAEKGEAWASEIEQVQAHMSTLERYLSRREAQGRLLPETELMVKELYRKLAAHEVALRRPRYGSGQLTPAEIREYTQQRLKIAQAEYDSIQLQIDELHRQLLDTEVSVAKREVDRINDDINRLLQRVERREGVDLGNQELAALTEQHNAAIANLEAAQKTFAERKKAKSVPFTRKSPESALAKWLKNAQARYEQSVQRFKDRQKALELSFATPESRSVVEAREAEAEAQRLADIARRTKTKTDVQAATEARARANQLKEMATPPVTTSAERRSYVKKDEEFAAREAFKAPAQTLEDQLRGALNVQKHLKNKGSKKQRAAISSRIKELRAKIAAAAGESAGSYGTEYYTQEEQAQAAQEAREEAEARKAGKEGTTKAGRRKAAKEIFGVQRTIAETGKVPQADKDANKLDAVIKSNRQAFEMAVEQGFKTTAIRPQRRGKSATSERLMRTPVEGILYRKKQELEELLKTGASKNAQGRARTPKQHRAYIAQLRKEIAGLQQASETPPVTVTERRQMAAAIFSKLPKAQKAATIDAFPGALTDAGNLSVGFFDRFADALETNTVRRRLGQKLSETPVVVTEEATLAPIQAETEKRTEATLEATREQRERFYEQKAKELAQGRQSSTAGKDFVTALNEISSPHSDIEGVRVWNDNIAFVVKKGAEADRAVVSQTALTRGASKKTSAAFLAKLAELSNRLGATVEITGKARERLFKTPELLAEAKKLGWAQTADETAVVYRPQPIEKLAAEYADRIMQRLSTEAPGAVSAFDDVIFKESRKDKSIRAVEAGDGEIQFSRGATENPSTTSTVRAELKQHFPDLGRVQIYDSVEALIKANPQYKGLIPDDARGFVDTAGNKAFLIAENINQGQALSVLLHEVGAHIGFRNIFNTAQYNALVKTVKRWASLKNNSLEARIGRAAMERVKAAKTPEQQVDDELLAYAVEEAVNAGVEPAGTKNGSVVQNWLRLLADGFRKALEILNIRPQRLEAGDLVTMAYGAARLELQGMWHGSDRQFTAFDPAFAGSGEGEYDLRFVEDNSLGKGPYVTPQKKYAEFYQKQVPFGKAANAAGYGAKSYQDYRAMDDVFLTKTKTQMSDSELQIFYESRLLNRYLGEVASGGSIDPYENGAAQNFIDNTLKRLNTNLADAKKALANREKQKASTEKIASLKADIFELQRAINAVSKLNVSDIKGLKESPKKGHLYRTLDDIPPSRVFNIHSKQSFGERPDIDALVRKYGPEDAYNDDNTFNANSVFYAMRKTLGADATVKALKAAGIDALEQNTEQGRYVERAYIDYAPEIFAVDLAPIGPRQKERGSAKMEMRGMRPEGATNPVQQRMYHGSPDTGINAFTGLVFYTPSREVAKQYADNQVFGTGKGASGTGRIYEETVSTKNTLDMRKQEHRALYEAARKKWNATADVDDRLPPLTSEGFVSTKTGVPSFGYAQRLLTAMPEFDSVWLDEGSQGLSLAVQKPEILFSRNLPVASRVADSLIAKEQSWLDKVKANLRAGRTQFIDKLAPVEEALKKGEVDEFKANQALYNLRMYEQRMHFTAQAFSEGVPGIVEKTRKDGRTRRLIEAVPGANIKQIVDILKAKDVVKEAGSPDAANKLFTLYLAAIRGERVGYDALNFGKAWAQAEIERIKSDLKSTNISPEMRSNLQKKKVALEKRVDSLPTADDIKAARAEIEANPTLKKAFDEARDVYNQYNRNLMKFAMDTGSVSKDLGNKLLASNDYIPYYRLRDGVAELMIGKETPVRIGNLKDSPHLQELIGGDEAIFDFLTSSVQNTSMLIDMSMKNLATRNLMYELRDVGLAKIAKVKGGNAPTGSVTFKRDGEEYFAVVDTDALGIDSELLVKGLAGIPTMFPQMIRVLGIPARLLRRLVVASPVYMARQLVRDSAQAAIASGANMVPVISSLKQIGKPSVLERRGVTGGMVFTGMPEDQTRLLKEMMAGKLSLTSGLARLEAMSAKVDALTREAQYESYLAQGLDEMEATLAALESMNFSRRGLSPTMHMLSTLIPFFNAQIQGLDVLNRSRRGDMPFNEQLEIRKKLYTRGAMLFGLSMVYATMMQDDEAYKTAKPEDKYSNFFVPIPGTEQPLRIPIPFELGYIFKALPEALVNIMLNEEGGEEAFKALKFIAKQTVPGLSSYFLPQAVKPVLEVALDQSIYTGRDIESAQEKLVEPGYRVRETTTELAKQVGELTGVSPIKLEYLIRGYTGSLGMALVQAVSVPFGRTGPEAATKRPSDLPVVGTMFQPTDASGIIDAVYERMNKARQVKETYDSLVEKGRSEAARAYLDRNLDSFVLSSLAGSFKQQMGEITQYEKSVRASSMSADQKREALDRARQAKINLAKAVRAASDRTERQAVPA